MHAGFGGWSRQGMSAAHQSALTASNLVIPLTRNANQPKSALVPESVWLDHIRIDLDTIAGGASALTFFLARDAAGNRPITAPVTVTIAPGALDATKGAVVRALSLPHINLGAAGIDVEGTLYLVAALNVGTANGNSFLFWRA